MQHTISDLTVSVQHAFDADPRAVWRALVDRSLFERHAERVGDVERVSQERPPPPAAGTGPQSDGQAGPDAPARVVAGETYVGDLSVPVDGVASTFETTSDPLEVSSVASPRAVCSRPANQSLSSVLTFASFGLLSIREAPAYPAIPIVPRPAAALSAVRRCSSIGFSVIVRPVKKLTP
jgi:hypothetical protein